MALFALSCSGPVNNDVSTVNEYSFPALKEGEEMAGVNLTVAEGKRLIAKGLANDPRVKARMQKGIIVITTGSTNTYLAEELANLTAPRGSFVIGYVTPVGRGSVNKDMELTSDIVIVDGQRVDMKYEDALANASAEDIVFKGANLLNYERGQSAVCIGSRDGGPARIVKETAAHLIIPIGLEKETYGDLNAYEKLFENKPVKTSVPRVWVHPSNSEIFTEIEALKVISNVNVVPFAVGGIAGREGGVSLAIYGPKEEVQKALDFVATVQGEAPFVEN